MAENINTWTGLQNICKNKNALYTDFIGKNLKMLK